MSTRTTRARSYRWISATCCAVYAFFGAAAVAQTLGARSPNDVVPAAYFGMHIHRADDGTAWPGAGVGAWRLWDARVIWLNIEPKPEAWDFSKLDRLVAMGGLARAEVMYVFGMPPQWASARPDEKGLYSKAGDRAEPARLSDWERMIRTVVSRYRGRIKQYELWNEINEGTGFFSGTPDAMLALQRSAYRAVKETDPGAIFVGPSGVGETEQQIAWFERYLALGAAQHADVISYHFYQPRKAPEEILGLVRRIRSIMDRHGAGAKPLWNTESGYRMDYGQTKLVAADPTWPALSRERAEGYVARALVLGWWAGLDRFYWYAWDNADMGLIDSAKQITPAAVAFRTVARWMTGAKVRSCTRRAPIWVCALERNSSRAWIVWTENEQRTEFSLASLSGVVALESLAGSAQSIVGQASISVDGKPVLLRDDDTVWAQFKGS